jgi:hypothetical protein
VDQRANQMLLMGVKKIDGKISLTGTAFILHIDFSDMLKERDENMWEEAKAWGQR